MPTILTNDKIYRDSAVAIPGIFNAAKVATTIGIMNQGRLVQQLPSKDFSADELQQRYLKTV